MKDQRPGIEKLEGSAQEQYVKLLVNTMYDLQKPRVSTSTIFAWTAQGSSTRKLKQAQKITNYGREA